jgi:hypothetical protein
MDEICPNISPFHAIRQKTVGLETGQIPEAFEIHPFSPQ